MDNVTALDTQRPLITYSIVMPDGESWPVSMPEFCWEALEIVMAVEELSASEIGVMALSEMEHQPLDWNAAYQTVLGALASQWIND